MFRISKSKISLLISAALLVSSITGCQSVDALLTPDPVASASMTVTPLASTISVTMGITPTAIVEATAINTSTQAMNPTNTNTRIPDLYVFSQGFRADTYIIKGEKIFEYHIGNDLVVYGEISPGTEVAIALLKVTQVNPDSISAQAILVHPSLQIRPTLRVDDQLDYISASELVPAAEYAVGYMLRPGRVRLRPNSMTSDNILLQALELEVVGETVLDALPFNPPILMRVVNLGADGAVASIDLVEGNWPITGTIVAIAEEDVLTTPTKEASSVSSSESVLTATQIVTITSPLTSTALVTGTTRVEAGITFIYVPGGEFLMGSPEDIGYDDEHPQHTVAVDDFWISLTEVTNAQYRHFVNVGGYTQEQWWTNAGWQWTNKNNITEPLYWQDAALNASDQPVVGVNWYEGVAYATWLAQETGLRIRLPTEAEWEKAARGTDGRLYPWGNAWDGTRLNYCDKNCERDGKNVEVNDHYAKTAPVGSYPTGKSPYNVEDMAGNVWEWTSSLYKDYPYRLDDGREDLASTDLRVIRGGSWFDVRNDMQASHRFGVEPNNPSDNLGFRLVIEHPSN